MDISSPGSRTSTEIMAQILDAVNDGNGYDGIRNTHIIYKANPSYGKLKEF